MSVNGNPAGRYIRTFVLVLGVIGIAPAVQAWDVFRTDLAVPPTAAGNQLSADTQGRICVFDELGKPLRLAEAIERSLCNNPKTQGAWATVKVQAAGTGLAKSAYLPTLSATWQETRDSTETTIYNHPSLSSRQRSLNQAYSVSLSWILYDFGGREAALRNAQQLLAAAQASHEGALQDTFMATAKDYYAAQAAYGNLVAANDIEQAARESFRAASARVDKGVSPVSDQLQAQTVYAQAVFNRTKAEGERQTALGTLMSDMNINPDGSLALPDVDEAVVATAEFTHALDELMAEAKQNHPNVRAAQAQLNAALEKVKHENAAGMPSVSLIGKYGWNNQPVSPSLGEQGLPASAADRYIGVQVSLPLFDGFNRTYQVRQAQAQAEVARATLDEARKKVAQDVWSSEYALRTATENIGNSATLLEIAQRSYQASLHRYLVGVGNILELLNTQTSLATAKKQRVQALSDWRTARLQLAAALGKLGMWQIGRD